MLLSRLLSPLLSIWAPRSAPVDPSPSHTCFTSSTLGGLVDCFTEFTVLQNFYDNTSYVAAQPTEIQRKSWYNAASSLLFTDNNCTSAIVPLAIDDIYSSRPFTDEDGTSFCVLYERTISPGTGVFEKGWGFMIVPSASSDVARHIHIAAPHPLADAFTSAQATQLFKETGAKSLIIPGRHRAAYKAPTDCIPGTGNITYYKTDPAHNDLEPFFDVNIAIYDWQVQQGGCPSATCAFIQLHGKANETCPNDTIFLSTGLSNDSWYTDDVPRPIKRLKEQLNLAFDSESVTVSLPSDSACPLTATKNVIARYLNNLPPPYSRDVCHHTSDPALVKGLFIHAEQSPFARSLDARVTWVQALKNTFSIV